jgi:hypothetical protein
MLTFGVVAQADLTLTVNGADATTAGDSLAIALDTVALTAVSGETGPDGAISLAGTATTDDVITLTANAGFGFVVGSPTWDETDAVSPNVNGIIFSSSDGMAPNGNGTRFIEGQILWFEVSGLEAGSTLQLKGYTLKDNSPSRIKLYTEQSGGGMVDQGVGAPTVVLDVPVALANGDRFGFRYAGGGRRCGLYTVTFDIQSDDINNPPVVNPTATPGTIHLYLDDPNESLLDAGASDTDALTYAWSFIGQPGTATFSDPAIAGPTLLNADVVGEYVCEVSVDDATNPAETAQVTVTVVDNYAPNAFIRAASKGRSIYFDESFTLAENSDDDGYPTPSALSYTWSVTSGDPLNIGFDPSANVAEPNLFVLNGSAAAGAYVLQLEVSDGSLSDIDTANLTVKGNETPTVDAGPDQLINSPNTATLAGIADDDGYPQPADPNISTWSSPDGVTFSDENSLTAVATFPAAGVYVLTLTADDGELSVSDTMTVTVLEEGVQIVEIDPEDDSYLRTNRDTEHNNGTFLKSGTGRFETYLQFDMDSDVPGIPLNQVLRLRAMTSGAALAPEVNVLAVTGGGDWDETVITEGNNTFVFGSVLSTKADLTSGATYEFSADGMVVEDGKVTLGVMAPNAAEAGGNWAVEWASKENATAANHPKLVVYYTPSAYDPSPANGSVGSPYVGAELSWKSSADSTSDSVYWSVGTLTDTTADVVDANSLTGSTLAIGDLAEGAVIEWQVEGDDGSVSPVWSFTAAVNNAPVVDAGDATATVILTEGGILDLDGVVSDDGMPPFSTVTSTWSDDGAGSISYDDINDPNTFATFTAAGTYTLTLTATDSAKFGSDTIVVEVLRRPLTTVVIPVEADTCIMTSLPDNNYGGKPIMDLQSGTYAKYGYVRYNAPEAAANKVVKAELGLTWQKSNGAQIIRINSVTNGTAGEWIEGDGTEPNGLSTIADALTYNNAADYVVLGAEVFNESLPIVGDVENMYDVIGMVMEGDKANFRLFYNQGNDKQVYTKEATNPAYASNLYISYDPLESFGRSPANGAVEVHPGEDFVWTPGSSDTSADVQVRVVGGSWVIKNVPSVTAGVAVTVNAVDILGSELAIATNYEWQVIGYGASVDVDSEIYSFTTVAVHPDMPVNISPIDAVDVGLPMTFVFQEGESTTTHILTANDGINAPITVAGINSGVEVAALNLETAYSWYVTTEQGTAYASEPTAFTTGDVEVIENFEDGIGAWSGFAGGSIAAESVIKIGTQSLALTYDDAGGDISEAVMALDNRDFSLATGRAGMQIYYHGAEANVTDDIYVKINGVEVDVITAVAINVAEAPGNAATTTDAALSWLPFGVMFVDLTAVAGVDDVTSIAIGVGDGSDSGKTGVIYIDDIIVHAPRCINIYAGDFMGENDCSSDPNELNALVNSWLLQPETVSTGTDTGIGLLVHFEFEEIIDSNYVVSSVGTATANINGDIALVAGPAGFGNVMDTQSSGYVALQETATVLAPILDDADGATIAFWAQANSGINEANGKLDHGDGRYFSGDNGAYWKFRTDGKVAVSGFGNGFVGYYPTDASDIVGAWNHMAFVADHGGGTRSIYINGELVVRYSKSVGDASISTNLAIGARNLGNAWPILMDDFRIYDRALPQDEIMAIAGVVGPITQGVVIDADTNGDGEVNLIDFANVADVWMAQVLWP